MRRILICIYIIQISFVGKSQDIVKFDWTGTDDGTTQSTNLTFNFSCSNVTSYTVNMQCPTDNVPVLHNTQNTTSQVTTVPNYTSITSNPDNYNNNFQQVVVDAPGTNSSATLMISGTTSVNIPRFAPADLYPLTNLGSDVSKYTNATTNIQSNDPTIKTIALSLVQNNTPLYKVVETLAEYVISNIDYDYSYRTAQDAIKVNDLASGTCAGYTNFMVALLRSIGIPARYVSGLLMKSNTGDLHAIYEVFYPSLGKWVQGDAQSCVGFCESNFIIFGHYADMADKPGFCTYRHNSNTQASLSFTRTVSTDFSNNLQFNVVANTPFPCNRVTCNLGLWSTSDQGDAVGIYDDVKITNPRLGTITQPNSVPVQNNSSKITPGTNASFYALFTSGGQPMTYSNTFDWSLILHYNGGTYTYAQQTLIHNTSNPNYPYQDGCVWTPTLSNSIPSYDWLRTPNGDIYGELKVTVHISDGDSKSATAVIGVVSQCTSTITNTTYSTNATINPCDNITLQNVIIQNNSNVTVSGQTNVQITGPFQVKNGSTFYAK